MFATKQHPDSRAQCQRNHGAGIPGGRVVGPADLSEKAERAALRRTRGRGHLAPYGGYDPCAEPVILIHGLHGNPSEMQSIIDRFYRERDKQVYVFFYRDSQNSVDTSGDDLAREIDLLRTQYLKNDKLEVTIIAHSMGGVVSQAAVNSMINPEWFADRKRRRQLPEPVIDEFAGIALVTLDSPLSGGTTHKTRGGPKNWSKHFRTRRAIMDMISRSRLFGSLYDVPHPASVEHHQFEAAAKSTDGIFEYWGLNQLKDPELRLAIDFILTDGEDVPNAGRVEAALADKKTGNRPLLNQLRALRQEQSYPELKADLEREPRPVSLAKARELFARYVPLVPGDHVSMLDDPALHEALVAIAESAEG